MTTELDVSYRASADAAIRDLLLDFECQPILFIGSGMSRRYFNGPNWIELLRALFDKIPNQAHDFEYYVQKFDGDAILIGTKLSELAFEWAWGKGRSKFPEEYFSDGSGKDIFLKHLATDHLTKLTPELKNIKDDVLSKEIYSISEIKPHAIITTNYDMFWRRYLTDTRQLPDKLS